MTKLLISSSGYSTQPVLNYKLHYLKKNTVCLKKVWLHLNFNNSFFGPVAIKWKRWVFIIRISFFFLFFFLLNQIKDWFFWGSMIFCTVRPLNCCQTLYFWQFVWQQHNVKMEEMREEWIWAEMAPSHSLDQVLCLHRARSRTIHTFWGQNPCRDNLPPNNKCVYTVLVF